MSKEGEVGELDLLRDGAVLVGEITHKGLVREVGDGDADSGWTQVGNSGTDFLYGSAEFDGHIGVIAKLGMFFFETFDEFQDGVLGCFHFILFYFWV
jgi:hypothetical protein